MNINLNQGIAIVVAVLGVLAVSAANLTDLFGAEVARLTVSGSVLTMSILGAVLGVLTGTVSQAKALAGSGVTMQVSRDASPAMARLAVDPAQDHIVPAPGEAAAVQANAAK